MGNGRSPLPIPCLYCLLHHYLCLAYAISANRPKILSLLVIDIHCNRRPNPQPLGACFILADWLFLTGLSDLLLPTPPAVLFGYCFLTERSGRNMDSAGAEQVRNTLDQQDALLGQNVSQLTSTSHGVEF